MYYRLNFVECERDLLSISGRPLVPQQKDLGVERVAGMLSVLNNSRLSLPAQELTSCSFGHHGQREREREGDTGCLDRPQVCV